MSTNPIMTTIVISIIANVCVSHSDRSSTTAFIVVVMVGINIKFVTNSKIGLAKNGVCIGIYSVFKGCVCVEGGVTIYIYICIYIDICIYIYTYVHVYTTYVYMFIYVHIYIYVCTPLHVYTYIYMNR